MKANHKPLVSIILPAFNEAGVIVKSLTTLTEYLNTLSDKFEWEILIVNDGSSDNTAELADNFAISNDNIRVIHHRVNRNLGGALRTGFRNAIGEYIVVLDIDLSYAPDHVEMMVDELIATEAEVVVASPYMKGGRTTSVPFLRLVLSKTVNKLMRLASGINIHTFTSMARAYKADFLKSLNLKSSTYSINPEIIQKATILRARIVEIPAHLDWSYQLTEGKTRTSSLRIYKGVLLGLMNSFIFRPYVFFMFVGITLLLISTYVIVWIFYHTYVVFPDIVVPSGLWNDRFTEAIASVFRDRPHAFFVGGFTLIVALQFIGIGFLSLQSKRYFDELFHLNSGLLRKSKES
ncbi:glycosyltransferase family 2 protein [Muriicola sp. Z0-33]|uniref:glycosyltransferase family 2 protein n=1 Tax=Muriicola sp. Z0-33 TaxID=2816957 RepID=UPI002238CBC9|nr:glycosyltransferase family 2 protein [Muriicola sp. Z0-33]MCW5515659.1 glycosyltransferase family 2 protein [Muriicola sp. Z0-33]